MSAAPGNPADDLEDLLAEALAKFDEGGESALAAFVAAHPAQAPALERGIQRCRQMGLIGEAAPKASDSHPERLGDFRLLRRIGGGGMGVVYEALQEPLGRRVALKVIRPELLYFEGARERFRREVDAVARLEHPAIVSVFAAGEHEGVPYFTMEMLEGVTIEGATLTLRERRSDPADLRGDDLRALVASADATGTAFGGAFWEAVTRIGHQVALGLRHAHLRGIVHRDIKPSNIMLTPHGQAVVLDFGVAQMRTANELTRSGSTPGSPAFMSPEQRRGEATDERTDVFSLAATLWQLLALQRPFRETEQGRAAGSLPRLRTLHRTAPPELDLVLRTAMDPDRERRHGDMAAFAADLQAVLDRRPIKVRSLGLGLRTLRWCQRHRTIAAAAAVAAAAGAVFLVVLVVVQRDARVALEAEQARTSASLRESLQAQQALTVEQARTRESLATSLDALQSILVRVGNDRLREVPQAEPIAHEVLEDAVALYRRLLATNGDDVQVQVLAGRAMHALAMSFARRGDEAKAVTTIDEALAVLGGDRPGSPSLHDIRGHAWMTKASWLADAPDKAPARLAIERAEADFAATATATDLTLVAESLRARGELCTARSLLADEAKEPQLVEAELRRAIDLQRQCTVAVPNAKDPALLVMRLNNLGRFLHRQNRFEEARPVLDEALAGAQQLAPTGIWPPAAVYVAEAQDALGSLLSRQRDPGAETLLRDAVEARRRAVAQYPSNVEFRARLGGALHNLGGHLWGLERFDDAMAAWEEARTLQEAVLAVSPQSVIALQFLQRHLDSLAFGCERRRDGATLVTIARRLAELPGTNPMQALRTGRYFVNAWIYLGKKEEALLDAAMAQFLVAEQRGLTSAQLPNKDVEALKHRDDYLDWRDRIRARQPATQK